MAEPVSLGQGLTPPPGYRVSPTPSYNSSVAFDTNAVLRRLENIVLIIALPCSAQTFAPTAATVTPYIELEGEHCKQVSRHSLYAINHTEEARTAYMDVSRMLSNGGHDAAASPDQGTRSSHQYSMRHTNPAYYHNGYPTSYSSYGQRALRGHDGAAAPSGYGRASPAKKDQKHVVFQLIDPEDPRFQARLPMRVMISTHDTTESIIATVKNFYGLYECGVSFENKEGISIVAAYDNFEKDMTVFVRVVPQPASARKEPARDSASPKKPSLGAPFLPQPSPGNSPSKAGARSAGARSMSPQSDVCRRSMSAAPGSRPRPQRTKSKDNGAMEEDAGYSSGDNGGGSVTSSRRSKTELVNAEISVDNIVEGGRRKGAFESSVSRNICRSIGEAQQSR